MSKLKIIFTCLLTITMFFGFMTSQAIPDIGILKEFSPLISDYDEDGDYDGLDLCKHINVNNLDLFTGDAVPVKFCWTPNSEADLAGYKIYYGVFSRDYISFVDVGKPDIVNNKIIITLSGFVSGKTYYFTATAYDTDGFESNYSTEVVWTAP